MRRAVNLIRVVAVYLLAGLVASVGVAWGLAWGLAWGVGYSGRDEQHDSWYVDVQSQGVGEPIIDFRRPGHAEIDLSASIDLRSQATVGGVRRHIRYSDRATRWLGLNRQGAAPPGRLNLATMQLTPPSLEIDGGFTAMKLLPEPGWSELTHEVRWPAMILGYEGRELAEALREHPVYEDGSEWLEEARGLPLVCLWQEWRINSQGTVDTHGGIPLPDRTIMTGLGHGFTYRGLPLRPVWAGLAANTVFYALVFWIFVQALQGLRGWHRFKRGLCPACAYDLRFDYSRGCSECGRGAGRAERMTG